ncbi:MAG TPA: hypothetical protein VN706_15840 [Gemmatimonadaceae bacterium]|nr:hypothetical protein [Gemmatimonadaceae bacterium]
MADEERDPITTGDERRERDLNRHRLDEQRTVRAELVGRLRSRGITVPDADSSEEVVRTVDAVEAFERAVEAQGGDLMVDTPPAQRPDNRAFVIPTRAEGESAAEFIRRVQVATARLVRAD